PQGVEVHHDPSQSRRHRLRITRNTPCMAQPGDSRLDVSTDRTKLIRHFHPFALLPLLTPRVALSINRLVDLFHFSQFILAHGPDDVSPVEAVRPDHAELVHDFYVRGHRPQVRPHQGLDVLLDKVPDLIRRNVKYTS